MKHDAELISIGCELLSGGLGPTPDDITRDALAGLFGRDVVMSAEARKGLSRRYAARGREMTPPAAERQALVLDGAAVLLNPVGAAPGERLDLPEEKTLFVLPGPPNEFSAVLEEHVVPWLRERFDGVEPQLERIVLTEGIGESDIMTRIEKAGFIAPGVSLGFYPGQGMVEIILSAPADQRRKIEAAEARLRELLHDHLA